MMKTLFPAVSALIKHLSMKFVIDMLGSGHPSSFPKFEMKLRDAGAKAIFPSFCELQGSRAAK